MTVAAPPEHSPAVYAEIEMAHLRTQVVRVLTWTDDGLPATCLYRESGVCGWEPQANAPWHPSNDLPDGTDLAGLMVVALVVLRRRLAAQYGAVSTVSTLRDGEEFTLDGADWHVFCVAGFSTVSVYADPAGDRDPDTAPTFRVAADADTRCLVRGR